ncbi:MAG TPA: NADH-quinone oxidoreductase subunit K [Myxococcaceae bacterium]|nr:NADH-quinone oxidoreductase subunit K [Myxococcaceae bacterium]
MSTQLDLALLVAVVIGVAIYLCLSSRFHRVLLGFLLLSNGANLAVLGMSGDPSGKAAALVADAPGRPPVDPLPQALILTAIVIGFSVAAYFTVLLYRIYTDGQNATLAGLDDPGTGDGKERAS